MKKSRVNLKFVCQSCGYIAPKWLGKCPECENWNSFSEEIVNNNNSNLISLSKSSPVLLSNSNSQETNRLNTKFTELDRVLGGGFVSGSVILLGGDPGIGKSTLALQIFSKIKSDNSSIYVSAEESVDQINLRANRIGASNKLYVLSETNSENIIESINELKAEIVVIDSIQTIYTSNLSSSPGSVSQIRECATQLVQTAKKSNTVFIIIVHVTKEGNIAGPKILEHLVDTVLYFEGGKGHTYRILRAWKNRFGATNEIGVFEMLETGLKEIKNPSEIFLSERPANSPGSVVSPSIEGTRPILVEIQSLVSKSNYGMPRRTIIGLDSNKVALLIAVLDKIAGVDISDNDVFMNVAGGVNIDEPSIDLAILLSLYSSFTNKPIDPKLIVFGEIGLSGEIRGVSQATIRLKEAEKLGFKSCLIPNTNLENLSSESLKSINIVGIKNVKEAIEYLS